MRTWICVFAIATGAGMNEARSAENVVDVTKFGAVAGDGKDDAKAVARAIAACKAAPGSVLTFPKGRYDFFADPPRKPRPRPKAMSFRGIDGVTVDGRGSTLMFHGLIGVMHFDGCRDVTVRNLVIDWERPLFSHGTVVATGDKSFDLKVDGRFGVHGGEPVEAFMQYDPKTHWPARRCIDVYYGVTKTELVAPQVLRLHLKGRNRAKKGMLMVIRHKVYGPGGISFRRCTSVRVENVTIYTVPGFGVSGSESTDLHLKGVKIVPKPGSGRIMSVTADATHFNGSSGTITIEDCVFAGMGDDATNVHGMFHRVTKIDGERTVTTVVRNNWLKPPEPGHAIEFTQPLTLLPYATGVVKSVKLDRQAKVHHVTFEKPLPKGLEVGHVLGNTAWAPKLRIRNCRVIGNRARGFLIQTRDAVIENCHFAHSQATGLNITADYKYWTESIGTRKIVVRGNVFEDLNNGADWHAGMISIFADTKRGSGTGAPGVHRDILIEGNTFRGSDGAAVYVGSADGVVIRNNRIEDVCRAPGKTSRAAAIYIRNSRNVTVTGNTLAGARSEKMEAPVTVGPGCDRKTITVKDNKGF